MSKDWFDSSPARSPLLRGSERDTRQGWGHYVPPRPSPHTDNVIHTPIVSCGTQHTRICDRSLVESPRRYSMARVRPRGCCDSTVGESRLIVAKRTPTSLVRARGRDTSPLPKARRGLIAALSVTRCRLRSLALLTALFVGCRLRRQLACMSLTGAKCDIVNGIKKSKLIVC